MGDPLTASKTKETEVTTFLEQRPAGYEGNKSIMVMTVPPSFKSIRTWSPGKWDFMVRHASDLHYNAAWESLNHMHLISLGRSRCSAIKAGLESASETLSFTHQPGQQQPVPGPHGSIYDRQELKGNPWPQRASGEGNPAHWWGNGSISRGAQPVNSGYLVWWDGQKVIGRKRKDTGRAELQELVHLYKEK